MMIKVGEKNVVNNLINTYLLINEYLFLIKQLT
jgi:hypothetical protein